MTRKFNLQILGCFANQKGLFSHTNPRPTQVSFTSDPQVLNSFVLDQVWQTEKVLGKLPRVPPIACSDQQQATRAEVC